MLAAACIPMAPVDSDQKRETSSQRPSQPDFPSRAVTWISTVASAHPSSRAMALFDCPRTSSPSTCPCRGVRRHLATAAAIRGAGSATPPTSTARKRVGAPDVTMGVMRNARPCPARLARRSDGDGVRAMLVGGHPRTVGAGDGAVGPDDEGRTGDLVEHGGERGSLDQLERGRVGGRGARVPRRAWRIGFWGRLRRGRSSCFAARASGEPGQIGPGSPDPARTGTPVGPERRVRERIANASWSPRVGKPPGSGPVAVARCVQPIPSKGCAP